jgi:hypothetical protein
MSLDKSGHEKCVSTAVTRSNVFSEKRCCHTDPSLISTRALLFSMAMSDKPLSVTLGSLMLLACQKSAGWVDRFVLWLMHSRHPRI